MRCMEYQADTDTGEVSVHRACCERATQLYLLGGGIQAQDQQVLPQVVREC